MRTAKIINFNEERAKRRGTVWVEAMIKAWEQAWLWPLRMWS
jgi:hypothetical protein